MSLVRLWLEVAAVVLLSLAGTAVGGMTGQLAWAAVGGMLFPLAAATLFLRREGLGWRDVGFPRRLPLGRFVGYTSATLAIVYTMSALVVTPAARALGAPPLDVEVLRRVIEGDTAQYLLFLIPVSWGSAAFGEELIARGFLQHRFARLGGRHGAVWLQASVFAAAHFYQGPTGVANVFALALVFGYVYYRCGRNLWPLIAAHGIIDSIGVTLLYLGAWPDA